MIHEWETISVTEEKSSPSVNRYVPMKMNIKQTLKTIRYMRPQDIRWRVTAAIKYRFYHKAPTSWLMRWFRGDSTIEKSHLPSSAAFLLRKPNLHKAAHILHNRFTFLNHTHHFDETVAWNTPKTPKLWLYNLHYFDYLFDLTTCGDAGIKKANQLMTDWIAHNPIGRANGWEPYTLALRIVNWVKFLLTTPSSNSQFTIYDSRFTDSLYVQAHFLAANLEPSAYSNHTLKSRKALLFAGAFFQNAWFEKGLEGFATEIDRQILSDGGHNERSPMYHLLALEDALDCVALLTAVNHPIPMAIHTKLPEMLSFAASLCHTDGTVACFNDAAEDITLPLIDLLDFAAKFGYHAAERYAFPETGYYILHHPTTDSRMIIDCGGLGPCHNPGHAHCDALSYELTVGDQKVIVNSGTYEYQAGEWRDYFRSTRAHNTIVVDGQEQAELWASFRAATRLRATCLAFDDSRFEGIHDGYRRLRGGMIHRRSVEKCDDGWTVQDRIEGTGQHTVSSFIHFHPEASVERVQAGFRVKQDGVYLTIVVPDCTTATLTEGELSPIQGWYSPQFGVKMQNPTLILSATGSLPIEFGYQILIR
jgi:uncharacterized heparinase superfamily protein